MALDVACGSGQSTFLLCNLYRKVIGVDISKTQVEQAKLKSTEGDYNTNSEFIVGDAHQLPIDSSSVDLLTCATAWHWLDAEKFYAEAKRVLKPRGCIAVYSHGIQVVDNERINNAFDTYYQEIKVSGCFAKQNQHVVDKYKAVELPFLERERIEFEFPQQATIEQLLGYLSSISMYATYCEKFPSNTLLQDIRANYEAANEKCDVEKFTLPGFVMLGLNQ